MCAHVLVAEDDHRQAEILRSYLACGGHQATVVHNGQAALEYARSMRPDLLILDVMMPQLDGLDVCRILRRESAVPVLMLTARSDEEDLIAGLDLGADDYLTKPYSPRELMARVRTLLRRVDRVLTSTESVLQVGPIRVDKARHLVSVNENIVECTPGEFAILTALAEQPDRVFSRSQLREHINGFDRDSTDRVIDNHMLNLRRKLEADPRRPSLLVTVYGVGYKLSPPARRPDQR